MPRPTENETKRGKAETTGKFTNPFSEWLASRKERKQDLENQAAKKITNETAKNESLIIDQLKSIDFGHSRLPKEILEYRSNENQSCGDLEYASLVLANALIKDPQTIKMDIREIDKRLLTLAMLFRQAVEQGDAQAAYAAKAALARGIRDIRTRIPQNQPELAKQFVEKNAQYLDGWITLVGLAQGLDRIQQNVDSQRKVLDQAVEKDEKEKVDLMHQIENDLDLAKAFDYINTHDAPEERAKWPDAQRKAHVKLIDQHLRGVTLDLNKEELTALEQELIVKKNQVETLQATLAALPIVEDPDLMNKYQEKVDNLFKMLAEQDAEMGEVLCTVEEIEGRLDQLFHAPGSQMAREVVAEQTRKFLEEIQKKQEDEIEVGQGRIKEVLERLGIRSEEEQWELIRQAEEQEQQILQQVEEFEQEGELLYE
ncbi:MAG: hypothetical protein LUH16_06595 [Clostridiales bacterium]|nr:hypothetical protein [Clostridiales bacterium]